MIGCIISGFILFGKQFIRLWVGDGYSVSYWVTILLMLPGSIDLIQVIGIEIQRSQNLHKFRGIIYIIMAMVNIALSIPLCKRWGAVGSAVGTAFSFLIVQGVIINIYLHKRCNVDIFYYWRSILRMSCGIIPLFIFWGIVVQFYDFCSWFSLILGVLAYCIMYVISMWVCGFNTEEKQLIHTLLLRLKIRGRSS